MIMSGLTWFFVHQFIATALVLVLLCGGFIYAGIDYLEAKTADKVTVKEAKPLGEGVTLELVPKAFAGGDPIVIKGKLYGYADPSVQVWKLAGEDVYLVWDKINNTILRVDAPTMREYRQKKQ